MADPLAGDVEVPVAGKVPKKAVAAIAVGAVAFIAWRYYAASQASGDGDAAVDPGMEDPGTLPAVQGAVRDDNLYGSGGSDGGSTVDGYGFTGTTNSQWTQYATGQLTQSDVWTYTDISTALGNYLAGKPLSSLQQNIVNAAVGVAGQPPVGYHTVVPGGNTPVTIAPSGLKATSTANAVVLTFGAVSGAAGYRAYKNGTGTNVGSSNGTSITVSGLQPNTTYKFAVKAYGPSGSSGPASTMVSIKTKGVTLKQPNKPSVSAIQKTSAHLSTGKVAAADGYNWYINGVSHGHSDAPSYTVTALKPATSYKVTVRADTSTGSPGPSSNTAVFKTKK